MEKWRLVVVMESVPDGSVVAIATLIGKSLVIIVGGNVKTVGLLFIPIAIAV
jgi:hypothetical protein